MNNLTAIDLFAGVGGFHLAAKNSGWKVVWANQWEPGKKVQHAYDCYVQRFPGTPCINEDIAVVLDGKEHQIPDHNIVLGGFPCQDYSVATTGAQGIRGHKGVLWWEIAKVVQRKKPNYLLLENVDRLLKSPTSQRGRDFAIMLATLDNLKYKVEWRVINAADYGFPQKRRRVFIFAWRNDTEWGERFTACDDTRAWLSKDGLFAQAFPAVPQDIKRVDINERQAGLFEFGDDNVEVDAECGDASTDSPDNDPRLLAISKSWQKHKVSPFMNAGLMVDGIVHTCRFKPSYEGPFKTLGEILEDAPSDDSVYVPEKDLKEWKYLKGSKAEERTVKSTGFKYFYKEGAIPFPDNTDTPSRTILTSEGGKPPSRFKHIIKTKDGRYRRLTAVEVERLNGFPDDWTNTGMRPNQRYFCMGNALVVGVVEQLLRTIKDGIQDG